jgi:hypothetical protein
VLSLTCKDFGEHTMETFLAGFAYGITNVMVGQPLVSCGYVRL